MGLRVLSLLGISLLAFGEFLGEPLLPGVSQDCHGLTLESGMNELLRNMRAWHVEQIKVHRDHLDHIREHGVHYSRTEGDAKPLDITDQLIVEYEDRIAKSQNIIDKIDEDLAGR